MTQPTAPTRPPDDRRLARDVARQLDRRRARRRLVRWTALLLLVAAAALYLRWGRGLGLAGRFGLGGYFGLGGSGGAARPAAGPPRCAIRVSLDDITVGGKVMSRDEAVAACKAASGADVVVTGDAREGDWRALRTALEAAGLKDIAEHRPGRPAGSPADPPRP